MKVISVLQAEEQSNSLKKQTNKQKTTKKGSYAFFYSQCPAYRKMTTYGNPVPNDPTLRSDPHIRITNKRC
jgi:hypothetical protein